MKYSNTSNSRRKFRHVCAALSIGLSSVLALTSTNSVLAAAGTISGTVFHDFNSNGVRDTAVTMGQAVDSGVGGIVVRAFDSSGTQVGSASSLVNGTYSLSISNASTNDVRIEFSIPMGVAALEGLQSSFASTTGASGSTSGSAVQFASVGDTNVNYAVIRPGDYCQNNPTLVTCAQVVGIGTNSTVGAFTIPSRMPDFTNTSGNYNSTTASDYSNSYAPTSSLIGSSNKLGAIFGIGIDRSKNAFFGTYVKRHVEYGPGGNTNTIYRINMASPGTVTPFVTLPGTLPLHNATPPTGYFTAYVGDTEIYDQVGRVGLGDVDVTPDGKTLLAVDMDEAAPKLYFVPILGSGANVNAGSLASLAIPRPQVFNGVACQGNWHPMGLGVRGNRILLGGVCGAENTVTPQSPNGTDPTQAAAFIFEYSGSRAGVGSFSTIWAQRLDMERGCVYREPPRITCDEATSTVGSMATADWAAWNDYPTIGNISNPQPMLSNIEILDTGGFVLGFRDRFFDQNSAGGTAYSLAYEQGSTFSTPSLAYPQTFGGMAAGDLMRVCLTSSGLVMESAGTCPTGDYAGTNVLDASGSREYFGDAFFAWGNPPLHSEVMNGSLTSMPGYSGVWSTAYDVVTMGTQGVYALGQPAAALGPNVRPAGATGYGAQLGGFDFGNLNSFNKGNGLADIEILCDMAPVQIGDRAWFDADTDGIQDAGEQPIAGVTVRLYNSSGVLVSTAVTNTDGEYLFSSTVTEAVNGGSIPDAFGGNLQIDQGYTIRFDNPADYAVAGPLAGYGVTQSDSSTAVLTDAENAIDSDAIAIAGYPQITVPTLSAGENNHSFDAGFVPLVGVGNYVWIDSDSDGLQDAGESPLPGVTVELLDENGNPAVDAFGNRVTPQVTDSNGKYFFDGLVPGNYQTRFTPPANYSATRTGSGTAATDSDVVPSTGLSSVFYVGTSPQGTTVADSDGLTVARFVNNTIDAGFVPVVSVGDYVWFDTDNDGLQENGEPSISGVVLSIKNADGTPVVDVFGNTVITTTTDVNGKYSFDNLPPGQYTVSADTSAGMTPTVSNKGTASTDSSTESATSVVLTAPGSSDLTLDFGFWAPPAAVGSLVWNDLDADGRQDIDEPGVGGVMLTLTLADGTPARDINGDLVQPTFTDGQGNYLFSNLPLGQTYRVEITYPKDTKPTTEAPRLSKEIDSSTDAATSVLMSPIRQVDLSLDFGLILPPCNCPMEIESVLPAMASAPDVLDQKRIVAVNQAGWLNPFVDAKPSKGSHWNVNSTRLWDASTKKWTHIIEESRGSWHVIRGQVRFTPAKGFKGSLSIPYRVTDASGKVALADLHITVVNELPQTGRRHPLPVVAFLLLCIGFVIRPRMFRRKI